MTDKNLMNTTPGDYDALELATDLIIKHKIAGAVLIDDIISVIQEAYGDGWCTGFNEGAGLEEKPVDEVEWWEHQDMDEDWVDSHDLADLEAFYGEMDLHYLQKMLDEIDGLEEKYAPMDPKDLPPGFPFDRKEKKDD